MLIRARPPEAAPEGVCVGAFNPQRSTVQLVLGGWGAQERRRERRVKERVEAPVWGLGSRGSWMLEREEGVVCGERMYSKGAEPAGEKVVKFMER